MMGLDNKIPQTVWHRLRNNMAEALGDEFWEEISGLMPNLGPKVDIYQQDEVVVVIIELPGLTDPENIGMKLKRQKELIITGSIPCTYPAKEQDFHQKERFFGEFERRLALPCDIFAKPQRASFSNGILTLVFNKKPLPKDEPIKLQWKKADNKSGKPDRGEKETEGMGNENADDIRPTEN